MLMLREQQLDQLDLEAVQCGFWTQKPLAGIEEGCPSIPVSLNQRVLLYFLEPVQLRTGFHQLRTWQVS